MKLVFPTVYSQWGKVDGNSTIFRTVTNGVHGELTLPIIFPSRGYAVCNFSLSGSGGVENHYKGVVIYCRIQSDGKLGIFYQYPAPVAIEIEFLAMGR